MILLAFVEVSKVDPAEKLQMFLFDSNHFY